MDIFSLSEYSRRKFGLQSLEEVFKIISSYNIDSAIAAISGGMDSSLAVFLCKKFCNIKVEEAIFVYHRWLWNYIVENIKSLSKDLGLKLHVIDMSDEFERRLRGVPGSSVCAVCIRLKNELIAKKARELGYQYIITGHNGMDQIAFALLDYWRRGLVKHMEVSQFPPRYAKRYNVWYVRPLIRVSKQDIERLAKAFKVPYLRVYEPGDKPHIFIREGCPLQHIDPNVKVTPEILEKVKVINEAINELARSYKVPMAVKYPSLKLEIVTKDAYTRKLLENLAKERIKRILQSESHGAESSQ
jgi:PP-loop superfamily ATP-utilizing enzyme